MPEMNGLSVVQRALEEDAARQNKKYNCHAPNPASARFTVDLPQSPQNTKYSSSGKFSMSMPSTPNPLDDPEEGWMRTLSSCRFDKRTLGQLFKRIDRDGSGQISQRELICALRNHPDITALFVNRSPMGQGGHLSTTVVRHRDQKAQREEIRRIKEVFSEVDTDGSGSMEWGEFVDFFRRSGLLLEYQTRQSMNRTSLCESEGLVD